MNKISYILATNRIIPLNNLSINAIFNLAHHEKEIIVTGPIGCTSLLGEEIIKKHNIRFLEDSHFNGACQPINDAYKISDGNWVTIMSDDIIYPPNFLEIFDYIETDFFKEKDFKVVNLMFDGGPMLYTYGHDALEDGKSFWWPVSPYELLPMNAYPFNLIPMPFIHRDTIESKLKGYLYHPLFKHHYGDSWFGFYLCKHEKFSPNKWRYNKINYIVDKQYARCNTSHDEDDLNVFKSLVQKYLNGYDEYI